MITILQTLELTKLVESRRFLFFGGKGGVGKTTMAAATAVWLADQGLDTLIVATDPTVSLSATYGQKIGEIEKTRVLGLENLHALTINPRKSTGLFQRRLESMMSSISGFFGSVLIKTPCAEEMAAFDQFVGFLHETEHDHIVFDTAPTGHTLRELSMPFNWSDYMAQQIDSRSELSSSLGWLDNDTMIENLEREKARYDDAVTSLSESLVSAFNLVLLPEKLPIEETARAIRDLSEFGIHVQSLIVNEVIPIEVLEGNWFLKRRRQTQELYLNEIESRFGDLPRTQVPLFETDVHGIENLRKVGGFLYE